MAEEEKDNQQPEEQAPGAEEQASGAEETPGEEPQTEEASAEETPAGEQREETPEEVDAPAGEADSNGAGEETAEAEDASTDLGDEELEGLDWKARRRLQRSRQPAEQRPQQSPEERAGARREARKQATRRRAAYRAKRREKKEGGTGTPPAERRSAGRKVRQGRVVSSKPDKTITVQIEIARRHPQYEKIVRRSRTLHAHDARNEAGEGDLVRVVETRPLSRTKRWRLVEILEKAK
jgi:small subunit ribosomal protein S17